MIPAVSAAFVLGGLVTIFDSSAGLKCYNCTSKEIAYCLDPYFDDETYLIECDEANSFVCIRYEIKVEDKSIFVERECSDNKVPKYSDLVKWREETPRPITWNHEWCVYRDGCNSNNRDPRLRGDSELQNVTAAPLNDTTRPRLDDAALDDHIDRDDDTRLNGTRPNGSQSLQCSPVTITILTAVAAYVSSTLRINW